MLQYRRYLLSASALASALLVVPVHASALPSGGRYVSGAGSINKASQSVTVKQSSTTGIIDWNRFSVGKGNSVSFDNGSGATLNRVTGGNLSTIAGSLHATGSLYLMNNAGVIVSNSGHVMTGGSFVVSSGNIGTAFDNEKLKAGSGKVINKGTIVSGGSATLVGSAVIASGTIHAADVDLTATHELTADGHITARKGGNGGTVTARAGTIVIGAHGEIDSSATAAGRNGGTISVVARGATTVAGALMARGGSNGAGGSIETSGARLHVADGATISTLAENGLAGTWLIDPKNFTIASSGGDITGATLSRELANNNVTIHSSDGSKSGKGEIFVDDAVTWTSAHTLTLDALDNIEVNATISGANLDLTTTTGNIGIAKPIVMSQNVDLVSGEDISESGTGSISAANLSGFVTIVAILNGANEIGRLSHFSGGSDFGGIQLTNDETLSVANIASGPNGIILKTKGAGHNIIIDGSIKGVSFNQDQDVTLDAAGTVAESGAGRIDALAFSAESTGGMALNGENKVSSIGSLVNSGSGGVAMRDDTGITWMDEGIKAGSGDLTLAIGGSDQDLSFGNGRLIAGGTVALSVSGNIDEGEFGGPYIQAKALSATAGGEISLESGNKVSAINSLTAGGSIQFNNNESLTVKTPIGAGSSNVTLSVSNVGGSLTLESDITGDDVSLYAYSDLVQKSGVITANTLSAHGGNVTLNGRNEVDNLDNAGADNDFSFTDARTLTVGDGSLGTDIDASSIDLTTVGAGHNIVLTGEIDTTDINFDGHVALNSAGSIEQVGRAARIDADFLEGTSHGGAALTGSQNEIDTLSSFSNAGGGDLTLSGIGTITGLVSNEKGNITLQTQVVELALAIEGEIQTGGTLNLLGEYVEELDGGFVVAKQVTANTSGFLSLGSDQNQIGELGTIVSDGDVDITNASGLKITGTVTSNFSSVDLTTVAGTIDVDNRVSAVNEASENFCCTVQLSSGGGIAQGGKGLLVAPELAIAANGSVALNAANQVGSLLAFNLQGNHNFSLTDSDALVVSELTGSGTKATLTTTGSSGITINGGVSVNALTLSSAGDVDESTGEIKAVTLSGAVAGNVDLAGGNLIQNLGAFETAGSFSLNNAANLTVAGPVSSTASGNISLSTTGAGHNITISGEITGGDLSLDSAAKILETDAGGFAVSALSGTSNGAVNLDGANNTVAELSGFSTAGANFDFSDDHVLETSGEIDVGHGMLNITTLGANSDLVVGGLLHGGILNLVATGAASETSEGAISAGILNVQAGTGIALTSANNRIGAIGIDYTPSGPNKITL